MGGSCSRCEPVPGVSEHWEMQDLLWGQSSHPTGAADKDHLCPLCVLSLMCPGVSADLLFGLPGRYSGVSLYNRRRVVSYTVTLGLQRYDSR